MFNQSAIALSELFKTGALSAKEIALNTFKRIEKEDASLRAFLSLFKTRALEAADLLDKKRARGEPLGKLAAIPIALKDNIHLKGELTTCASRFLANYRAPFSAKVVELMQAEDALLIGKTNMDEFAMGSSTETSAFQKTGNPWNLGYSPGGSSGGSAAAVAARFCPLSLGSDTGGSVRQPAALCGVVGFKPTYGRVSRYGLVAFASSLDQIGPFSRTVEEAALLMEVIAKPCTRDATSLQIPSPAYRALLSLPIKGKTVGICSPLIENLNPETKKNFLESLKVYESLGLSLVEIDLSLLKHSVAVYYILATAEASTNLARFDGIRYGVRSARAKTLGEIYNFSKQEGFGSEVKNRILLGTYVLSSGYQDAYYKQAQKVRTLIIDQFNCALKKCDIIAMPTSPPAFKINAIQDPIQMYLQDIYTIGANLAGLPAMSLLSGFNQEGLPLALQLIGRPMDDAGVLSFGYHFEKATDFTKQIPPLFNSSEASE